MGNLRHLAEKDLAVSLEGAWGLPVRLIAPDGERYETTVDGRPLRGQVLYGLGRRDIETMGVVVQDIPVVTLRRSSLARVPAPMETWAVSVPSAPVADAEMVMYGLSDVRTPEGGRSVGFIRLYLQELEAAPPPAEP